MDTTKEDVRIYKSSYRRDREDFMRTWDKWMYLILFVGLALVFSGTLRWMSLVLPTGFIYSICAVWLGALTYLMLKD